MSATISFNPYETLSPQSTFLQQTQGGVQGLPFDDTVARLWLQEGVLASTETVPMWGAVPIEVMINNPGAGAVGLGSTVKRSTSQATINGWSTYLQMAHMVIAPGSNAPQIGVNGSVGFFLTGSNARLWVQIDSTVVAAANASISGLTLYWSTTNYCLTTTATSNFQLPAGARLESINSNSKIVSYDSGTGAVTWTSGNAGVLII